MDRNQSGAMATIRLPVIKDDCSFINAILGAADLNSVAAHLDPLAGGNRNSQFVKVAAA